MTDKTAEIIVPRDGREVRRRLQRAALDLFQEAGYDAVTAAEIAARAGVSERTFFRHFSDKREVLFDGEALLSKALTNAIKATPPALSPLDTLFQAFQSVEQLFHENRAFSEPRQRVIANSPALQERAHAKERSLITALASSLCERGIEVPTATLAAQVGMAALTYAFISWLDGPGDLDAHLVRAFRQVRDLSLQHFEVGQSASVDAKSKKRRG